MVEGRDDKLRLQCNDFRENISSAFQDLRQDKDFTDITLACEDGQQVETHKMVLIASSPFFLSLLKRNKHTQTLVYMRGVKFEDLEAMMDFFYLGEANVFEENLESFLTLAEELQLKELQGNQANKGTEDIPKKTELATITKIPKNERKVIVSSENMTPTLQKSESGPSLGNTVAPTLHQESDLEKLDQKVKSMIDRSTWAFSEKDKRRAKICRVCGKVGTQTMLINHIESNHINGPSILCTVCRHGFKTRNALSVHKSRVHAKE